MARLARDGADKVYAVAERFRVGALESDGSVLTPGRAVWTAASLDEIRERFTINWDGGEDSFMEKLKRQLEGADDDVIQLMVEAFLMHVLVTVSIGGAKKRETIHEILGWMKDPCELPPEVDAALDYGLAGTGTFFNRGRDRQIRFIIEAMRAWKALPEEARAAASEDPWAFKDQVCSIEVNSAWMQRSALLHLLFPETFERSLSREDKAQIVSAFADLIGGAERAKELDEDQALLAIREVLSTQYGPDFDYYDTPEVFARWHEAEPTTEVPFLDRVLTAYPGWTGFSDPRFIKDEVNYKRVASENAQALLGAEPLRGLIDAGQFTEVISRVEKVGQSTNLLWLQVPKDGDLSLLYRQGLDQSEFAEQLYDLLHGEGESPTRLGRFTDYTTARGLPTKWALPTYLLMLLHPETDFFVKPRATKWFLDEVDAGFDLSSKASGEVYARILEEVGALREALAAYEPQSTVDVQGYIWVAFRTPPNAAAGVDDPDPRTLAAPFSRFFLDWETAWWAFDIARDGLVRAGVAGPDDDRLAATMPEGRRIHIDVGSWLLFGLGNERSKDQQIVFPLTKDSDLYQIAGGGTGFAADSNVTLGCLPLADARESVDALHAAMEPALDSAKILFEGHVRSPYRVYSRPELAEAIFDDEKRVRLLSEGIAAPEQSSVYDHIAAEGFHFPDWLVTDYVLSLATKPFVILSGISGTGKTKMAQLVSAHVAPASVQDVVIAPDAAGAAPGAVRVEVQRSAFEYRRLTIPFALVEGFTVPAPNTPPTDFVVHAGGQRWDARLYVHPSGRNVQVHMKPELHDWFQANARRGDYLELRLLPSEGIPDFELELAIVATERRSELVPSQRIAFLSVRPDWTDNRALLGYYNPLTQKYQTTELLRLLLRAQANPDEPHFVILDEMNLAKVEYYFSDFLSAVEADSELVLHDAGEDLILETLDGISVPQRLRVPTNVVFTGTVNVDETTYMFSPKVLDRANTLEFNAVDLVSYGLGEGFETGDFRLLPEVSVEGLLASYRKPIPQDWQSLPQEYADRLRVLHGLMAQHNLHFGYRVANEIARYLNLAAEFVGPEALETAYDLQVLQKILPKLSGSRAKLEGPLTDLLEHLAKEDLPLSAAKVGRMLKTVQSVGFVSFVE
ncbi:MAG: hypothetical protein U1E26_04765 [Coriobacteriia bacterium]|nr:hypothetical protein [Coriobacteriia bacterium]